MSDADAEPNELPDPKEVRELFTAMGAVLVQWEHIEDELFLLLQKLLNYPNETICSVLFHGPPSFEGRRVLIDRVVEASLMPDDELAKWKKLSKQIARVSNLRGQLAHFGLGFEVEFIGPREQSKYRLINPHLRPSLKNRLKSLKGAGYENKENRLSTLQVAKFSDEIGKVRSEIEAYRKSLIVARLPRAKRPRSETPPRSMSKLIPILYPQLRGKSGSEPSDE